jgi:hypothetical protein
MKKRALSKGMLAFTLALVASLAGSPVLASGLPTGERHLGQATIEPAYDDMTGNLVYLLTPDHAPFPATQINSLAVDPLYLVLYPPGTAGTFNCMGVPGNCPDHDGLVAGAATAIEPGLYGTNPAAVPGHDHLVGVAATHGDFKVAWHVYLELFTSSGAVTHITTLSELNTAKGSGSVIEVDSGIVFLCSVVSESAYLHGTPVP